MNKSYRIGYNFQRRVVKHLVQNGFNCVVQPKSAFPDIIAWKPFIDAAGNIMSLNTQTIIEGKISYRQFFPFFVSMVECKVNKYLSKQEKEKAKTILEEGNCNVFVIAYRNKRKLEFQEMFLENKTPKTKPIKTIPSYLG